MRRQAGWPAVVNLIASANKTYREFLQPVVLLPQYTTLL
jgi:hypothetical protein